MNVLNVVKNVPWKKVAGVASCVISGVVTAVSALNEHKQAEEFTNMKKRVAVLEELLKKGES